MSTFYIFLVLTGVTADQLIGTYGERAVDGSDFDFTAPELGSSFPADPSPEEYQFLLETTNLSPNCQAHYCLDFDMARLAEIDPDVIVMHGYRQSVWGFEANKTQIEEIVGRPIVFIDVSLEGPECTEGNENRCYGKSMVDVIEQVEELAMALGIDMLPSVQEDKKRMFAAAAEFQDVSAAVATRGVRVMAAYLSSQDGSDFGDVNYFANPVDDLVLRMLEELGLPLMHVDCNQTPDQDKCPLGYFWETVPTARYFGDCAEGQSLESCQDNVMYPIDFWLYDQRTTQYVTKPEFQDFFPDKAIQAGQYGYWPIGAGTISYAHAAEILELLTVPLAKAQRLHPATSCKAGVDVTGIAHRVVGLSGGEYACHNRDFHNDKYLYQSESTDGGSDTGLQTGMIVLIVAVGMLGFAFILGLGYYLTKQWKNEKQADTGTKEMFDTSEEVSNPSTTAIPM